MSSSAADSGAIAGRSLREAKRALRERVLRARDALPVPERARASEAIVAALVAREDFRAAAAVMLSLAFRSEWETRPLVDAALAAGKSVAVPKVNPVARMLEVYAITERARDLAPGFRGIDEPRPHCRALPLGAIDWVLVPGVAFDASGNRVGYGGGYYDRLLPLLRRDARRVAGAFELQLAAEVPAAPHDLRMDAIVTELRTLEIGTPRRG